MNPYLKKIAVPVYHKAQKSNLGKKTINLAFTFQKFNWKFKNPKEAGVYLTRNLGKVYNTNPKLNKGSQIKSLFEKIDISISDDGFIFFADVFKYLSSDGRMVDNISIDYSKTLDNSLDDFKELYSNSIEKNPDFIENQLDMIDGIESLIDRIIDNIRISDRNDKEKFISYFENIKDKPAEHFEEGLQRILFYNQLLWQTGHNLNGLGRLDKILNDLYLDDIGNGYITRNESFELIKDFLNTIHSYYWYKSSALMGDTGQVIILGGKEIDGSYFCNDLTYMFIEAINKLQLPDPKALLRLSDETPRELFELSLKTMNSGVGSPLLSNDDEVIPKMIEFGYEESHAYNYVVSACWEPSAVGYGLEQNNINAISYLKALNDFLDDNDEIDKIDDFDTLFESYKIYLKRESDEIISFLDSIDWNEDPLLSMFIDDCNERQLDISEGGARYNHYGLTTVSLANTVNSLLNIKRLVFDENRYSLSELNQLRKNNFTDDSILKVLKDGSLHFGIDEEEIVELSNEIIQCLEDCFRNYTNRFGGKVKFGLSAPSYISAGESVSASFDGRRNGEPFSTHISSDSNDDYTELMRFASKLDYGGCKFNGNVVDLMASPNFITDNFEKFTDFLQLSTRLGYFQMQMNVVDSKTLIEAKENPDLHPNLIVRVWGFSSYFNDLPMEYKDLLISRALANEGKTSV